MPSSPYPKVHINPRNMIALHNLEIWILFKESSDGLLGIPHETSLQSALYFQPNNPALTAATQTGTTHTSAIFFGVSCPYL